MPHGYEDEEIKYPLTIVNKNAFRKILESRYEIICEIEEDTAVHRFGTISVNLFGFLCRKK